MVLIGDSLGYGVIAPAGEAFITEYIEDYIEPNYIGIGIRVSRLLQYFCVENFISGAVMFLRFLVDSFSPDHISWLWRFTTPGRNLRISLHVIRRGRIPADSSSQTLEFFQ